MTTTVDTKQLAPGLLLREQGEIRELIASDLSRETIDAWVGYIRNLAETSPDGSVFYWIQDISPCKVITIPTYMRDEMRVLSEDLVKKVPKTIGHNALILPRSFISHMARLFVNSLPSRNKGVRRVFFTREEAVTWLEHMMEITKRQKSQAVVQR
jgi:hypothetical protein